MALSPVTLLLAELRSGERSCAEVAATHLDLLRRVDATTNAVASFEDDRAMADARALDDSMASGERPGPLHGLPITVKDWIDVEGFVCAGETDRHGDRRPPVDASVVARLRGAGAVVVAKTKAWGPADADHRVRHPLAGDRSPGGSSTGEAVVVAGGASVLGFGSDSGGSIRLPAAWCGVYGFKPTAGLVPTTGHFPRVGPLSDGRTQIGPLSRDLDAIELVLPIIAGPDGHDAGVAPVSLQPSSRAAVREARFAVLPDDPNWSVSAAIADAVETAATRLAAAGLRRVAWTGRWLDEALDITRRYWSRTQLTGAEAARQLWDWDRFRRQYLEAAEHIDLLLTPVTAETAPLHRATTGEDFVFTLPASLTGSPAIAVPLGVDQHRLPLSVQLIGRPWEDHRVLAAAQLLRTSA